MSENRPSSPGLDDDGGGGDSGDPGGGAVCGPIENGEHLKNKIVSILYEVITSCS